MSNGELQQQTLETPRTHTLRVAVFDFYNDALITRYGDSYLFQDVQEIKDNGLIGISHEHRATLVTNRQSMGRLGLTALGRKLCVQDYEGNSHEAFATMTDGPASYRFFRDAMQRGMLARRISLTEVYKQVDNSLKLHDVDFNNLPKMAREPFDLALEEADKAFDPVDALILDKARNTFNALKCY